jgi:ribosomal protein S18 acetylase RimI-like enzyme
LALRLRPARPADSTAIAALHAASWRDTYRGVMSDAFLDGAIDAEMRRHWEDALSPPRRAGLVLLATTGRDLAGFVAVWRQGPLAYIDNLHVRPGFRGAGIGRLLIGAAAERMAARGCTEAALEVFAQNEAALRFYRALGAEVGPAEPGVTFGEEVLQHRCHWPDIAALAEAASRPKG